MIRNKTGAPVRGDDFYNRESEQKTLMERLKEDNVLLLGPRRVGKTSLMYRLESMASGKGTHAVFMSVQDIRSELAFVEKLCSTVNEVDRGKAVLRGLKKRLKRLGRRVRKLDIGLESVGIELRDPDGEEWAVIGRDEKLRYLLDVLLNDGYLVKESGQYRFRSPLLRDFWLRRTLN